MITVYKKHLLASPALTTVVFCFLYSFVVSASAMADYRYAPQDKLDPFVSVESEKTLPRALGKFANSDVKNLVLVGTLVGQKVSAILASPDGKETATLHIGDKVGTTGGKIISIARSRIIVREPIMSKTPGKDSFRDTVIELARAILNPRPGEPGLIGSIPATGSKETSAQSNKNDNSNNSQSELGKMLLETPGTTGTSSDTNNVFAAPPANLQSGGSQ